ncbi:Acg family FMN-binding oxidoreductase [Smaragdicoccus niigatensis]|uniref:Acg family FMN-binding oxidoreductase n=1 Tax=Smaragdicoccus niigatensis TaxID=359359 RepID=UPI00047685D2|nr:nitroreductase family protein [Smaragdicoccus niigatensis]
MERGLPDDKTVRTALALAVRAPSVHNTQPWRWRIGDRTIHLYADLSRHLESTDPDRRDLMLSCGAALHHLRVGLAALGWSTAVHRLPDPSQPDHVASVEVSRHTPTDEDIALAAAISRRRSDRRRYSSWPVPNAHIRAISDAAAREGVLVYQTDGPARATIEDAVFAASQVHANEPEYLTELAIWTGRNVSADGVPAKNAPVPGSSDPSYTRQFAAGTLADPVSTDESAGELLVFGTSSDDPMSQLRAGEAMSAALLTATAAGLAACPLTEPLEVSHLRTIVRTDVLDDNGFPQMILRVGWAPIAAGPLPETPRRPLDEVIDPFDRAPATADRA